MALHLNLLHEQILEERQRSRDPLKIGSKVLVGIGALMALYYAWNAYQTLAIKSRLSSVERDWAKVEGKVTAAEKRSAELNSMLKTTAVLDEYIEKRFFWAPFLEKLSRCVAPNIQLTNLEGSTLDENKGISVTIEGVAAAREPRSAAEDLRQMLSEQLSQGYSEVKVEFKALDDLDTITNIGGASTPMAHYILGVTFQPTPPKAKPTATPSRAPKR